MTSKEFKPLNGILIEPVQYKEDKFGYIDNSLPLVGKIISDTKFKGEYIIYGKICGKKVKLDDGEFIIIKEDDILGTLSI